MRLLPVTLSLVAAVALILQVLLHSLDHPWIKARILSLAHASLGVDIDYRAARVDLLSGAEIEGLVVRSPGPVRAFAPDILRVGRVAARWSLLSLLRGRTPVVGRVAISNIVVTAVVDEEGRTSLDAFSSSRSTAPPKPVAFSRLAAKLLATAPPVGGLDVDDVALALVRTEHGEAAERMDLRGLAVRMAADAAAPPIGGWRVRVSVGSPESPLELALTRATPGAQAAARPRLWVAVEADSETLTVALDVRMTDQNLVARLAAQHWLHAETRFRFDPAGGRTEITLHRVEAADGSASAEALVDVADSGDVLVRRCRADIDLARLLRWLPTDLVPVTAEHATMHLQVESLVAGAAPRLSDGGAVDVDVDASNVAVGGSVGPIQWAGGALSVHAQAEEGGEIAGRGSARLTGVRLGSGAGLVVADGLAVTFDGRRGADEGVSARVEARFGSIERGAHFPLTARDGRLELRVDGVHLDAREPLASRGDVDGSVEVVSLLVPAAGMRATLAGLTAHAHACMTGGAPYAAQFEARASRLHVAGVDGNALVDAPASLKARVREVQPDPAAPEASRGVVEAGVDVGEVHASIEATKSADALDYAVQGAARSLKAVRPFLPPSLVDAVPWTRMAVALRSSGHIERRSNAGRFEVQQATELDVESPAFGNLVARSLSLALKSRGTALYHEAEVDLHALGLSLAGARPVDDHVALSATVDQERKSLQFGLQTEGHAAVALSGALSFDPERRAVRYETAGHLAGLAPLASIARKVGGLNAFDLSDLSADLSARGTLLGVVAAVARNGAFRFEPNPAVTGAIEGKADIHVNGVRWGHENVGIAVPALTWHGDMSVSGGRRVLGSRLDMGTLHLDIGDHDVALSGLHDEVSASIAGDLVDPEIELTQLLALDAVEQDFVPGVLLGKIGVSLSAERAPDGIVHLSEMRLTIGSGGTVLTLNGNVDLGEGRRSLAITTSATQDLERLPNLPGRIKGQGKLAVEASVTSPNLALYEVRAAVKGAGVSVSVPPIGVALENANGEVPISGVFEVSDHGVNLRRSMNRSPYSMLRFADQHPLLTRSGFLSIARLVTPLVSIAPLVGNLAVEQNVVSLRQFEMGVRGGTVTGQCSLDWDGPKSTVELHVRASGVRSSHGEPFDGNIAVTASAADRTIEGRAEILRIGPRHLLDLLDLEDPLRVDPGTNRIRSALNFGYPQSLRLVFDHGFASAHLELGGLARLISIGELRGIPVGPIVDKVIASVVDRRETKESQ
ncbi:MAG: hypothetical protein ABTD50_08130 [Polyangiaceae bacterium]